MSKENLEIYNVASEIQETRRIPDFYPYNLNLQGKLVLTYTGDIVEDNIETSTYIGSAELLGLQKLQLLVQCAKSKDQIAWLSPQYHGIYQSPKLIVGEVYDDGETKMLFNRAMVLDDLTITDTILFGRDLSGEFMTADQLRKNPINLGNDSDWLEYLQKYIDVSVVKDYIESGKDKVLKEEAIKKAKFMMEFAKINGITNIRLVTSDPRFKNTFGSLPLRCRLRATAFQSVFENSEIIGPTFDCPKCDGKIPAGKGITVCPHCGAKKEEVGSVCD